MLFFGGYIKLKYPEPMLNELGEPLITKTGPNRGQVKTKLVERKEFIEGLGIKPKAEWKPNKYGVYPTNEAVLAVLADGKFLDPRNERDARAIEIAKLMLVVRAKEKMLGTYYSGFEKFIDENNLIHGSINHCSTQTGRTSSTKPNLQNISN